MTGRIAILKPDHLGDVILAAPAVRKIAASHPEREVDLLCGPASVPLVRWLLPEVRPVPIPCAHLDKSGAVPAGRPPVLAERYAFLFGLRRDEILNETWLRESGQDGAFVSSRHEEHETWSQKRFVEGICGAYSRSAFFFRGREPRFPRRAGTVGLCVAAGFVNNRWDSVAWFRLGRFLQANGTVVKIVGGPMERTEARLLRDLLGIAEADVLLGGADFGAFVDRVEQEVDVVVATDSGTAHLCSLVKPVLSVFGPSPHRRYAPFGRHNRLIRRDVECSPCCQFAQSTLNACLTRECLGSLEPEAVTALLEDADRAEPAEEEAPPYVRFFGASHLAAVQARQRGRGDPQPPAR
jgi:heptosyltransferase-2